ncbi:MAG: FAD-dependent oxidoreductase [Pseudomonadota bacterium]
MKSPKNRLHSVMVVGATPAGVAATNKLGELGVPVILVDTEADLDAKLAHENCRLDSGVTLNFAHRPGLIRILRNPWINCIMPAAVAGAKHNQQGFSIRIDRRQTFVDASRCTLCGRCAAVCPVLGDGAAPPVHVGSRLALPGRAVIDKRREPLCQASCPLGVNVQGYMALTAAGRYAQALALIRQDNVLPGICGRICHHPCEAACRRADADAPLAIRAIKRFLADAGAGQDAPAQPPPAARAEKIAVVGSGPAGLAAAADLARQGFAVTVFEREARPGGLLRYGIGPHRLPREILDREIAAIEAMGVTIITGHPVDLRRGAAELRKSFDAVILTVGSWADRKLGAPGEDLTGVEGALAFLQRFYRSRIKSLKEKVAVIGDGNAAFDLARVLRRLGASVTLVSWFPKAMIPADAEEVAAAKAEGVVIVDSRKVTAFAGENGKLRHLVLMPTRPGPPDAAGIPWPVVEDGGKAAQLTVSRAFVAIGQRGAWHADATDLTVTAGGYLSVDGTGGTAADGIYGAGDAVTGASSVVQAMAAGRAVAARVTRDLGAAESVSPEAPKPVRPAARDFTAVDPSLPACMRMVMPEAPAATRQADFREVAEGYSADQARTEAGRCLQCGSCSQCLACVDACAGNRAIRHDEPARRSVENVGVMIIADPEMGVRIKGDDVIRAYGPPSAKTDVYAMLMRGTAAAAKAMVLLKDTGSRPKGHGIAMAPPDPGLAPEVRMGVFACRCNDSLGWTPEMSAYLARLKDRRDIVCAEEVPSACLPEGIGQILARVRDQGLTRVVLASCVCCPLNFVCSACTDQRSRLKEGLFNGMGISRSMVQTINLRGEVLRLVAKDPGLALDRFTGLMDRSILRGANLLPFPAPVRTYNFTTAVIGRSEAADTAALTMAEAGLEVMMFHRDAHPSEHPLRHPNIHTFSLAPVTTIGGTLGNFKILAQSGSEQWRFTVGGIVWGDSPRHLSMYHRHHEGTGTRVHWVMQKSGDKGTPFITPGTTSISGLFLADPPGIQISKKTKGAAVAALAAAVMPRGPRQNRGFSARVKKALCRGCGRCLAACPYQAIAFQPNEVGGYYAEVDDALCKGCGNCISVCPSDAADSPYRDHFYLEQTVDGLLAS